MMGFSRLGNLVIKVEESIEKRSKGANTKIAV
jgi:hypothetical protein